MPEYSYRAVDAQGHTTRGVMAADNESALEARLREVGYWLIDASSSVSRTRKVSSNVSRAELIEFLHGMASLLSAGVSAAEALDAMAEETENDSFKVILDDVGVNLNAGSTMHDAFALYPRVFTSQSLHLIQAGEFSGNLAVAFKDLAEHMEWTQRLMSDIKQATLYPAMIVTAVIALIALMITVVVPSFAEIFNDLDMDLPLLTRGVIALGDWGQSYGLLVLITIVMAVVGIRFSYKNMRDVRLAVDDMLFRVPVFGEINRMLVLSRFVHNLSLLLASGVPIIQALELCRGVVGNSVMENAVHDAEQAVNGGHKVSDALRDHSIITPLVLRMLVVGEETGRLDQSLEHAAARLDDEIPRRIKAAFGVLEPAIMLTLIGIVGLIGGAVFLPMFSLMSGLS